MERFPQMGRTPVLLLSATTRTPRSIDGKSREQNKQTKKKKETMKRKTKQKKKHELTRRRLTNQPLLPPNPFSSSITIFSFSFSIYLCSYSLFFLYLSL